MFFKDSFHVNTFLIAPFLTRRLHTIFSWEFLRLHMQSTHFNNSATQSESYVRYIKS